MKHLEPSSNKPGNNPGGGLLSVPGPLDLSRPNYQADLFRPARMWGDQDAGLLPNYWRLICRRKGAILIFGFLGVLTAIALTLPRTPVYQARTSIEVQGVNDNFLNMKSVDPTNALQDYSAEAYIQTQMKILQSDLMLRRTIQKLNEEERDHPTPSVTASNIGLFGWKWRKPLTWEETVADTARNVQVRMAGSTHIVEVFCDSTNPQVASDFANVLVREFIEHNRESRWKTTQNTGEWLTRQLKDIKQKLETSESQLQGYAQGAGLQFTAEKTSVAEERLRQLQQELSKAQADRILKQSAFDLAASQRSGSLPEIADNPSLREYQVKLVDLRRQRAELSSTMTPVNVKVRRLDAQITELEAALDKERVTVLKRIHDEYEAAQRREQLLVTAYDLQNKLVGDQSIKAIQYDVLKREVDTNRQLYESMLARVKEAGITAAIRASNLSVVDEALPPKFPYKPNLIWNACLGLIGGLVFGLAAITLRERSDRSIQNPGESPVYLDIPELGVIPAAGATRTFSSTRIPAARQTPDGDKQIIKFPDRVELIMCRKGPALLAESFRAMLASLLFSSNNGGKSLMFVLTSAVPGEGKTTIASNLSIAMAETRRRVLLVDADMRKPCLHEIFQAGNGDGLSELLEAEKPLQISDLESCLYPTGIKGLTLLPSGKATSSISDLLYSARLPELCRLCREQFDAVIFDTPPMMQMPDARILARFTDGVVLIVRSGKTTRDTALIAKERFREDGTPMIGTVLNDWHPQRSVAHGYQGYYRDYQKYYRRSSES